MGKTTKATLGGRPLLRSNAVRWELTEGVTPSTQIMALRPQDAAYLLANNSIPVTLRIEPVSGTPTVIEFLYVIKEAPGDNPKVRKVVVADRRVWWNHNSIMRDYNIRRNTTPLRSTVAVAGGTTAQGGVDVVSPLVQFWEWSLRFHAPLGGLTKWKPTDSIADVIKEIQETEASAFGARFKIEMFKAGPGVIDKTPWEGITLWGEGGKQLGRILGSLPSVGVTVRPDGTVAFFVKGLRAYYRQGQTRDESDNPAMPSNLSKLGFPIDGFGTVVPVNNRLLRPRRVIVKYLIESELMMEVVQGAVAGGTSALLADDGRWMKNVGQVTDRFISQTYKYAQGTWIPFDTFGSNQGLIDLWNSGPGAAKFSDANLRLGLLPLGPGMWKMMIVSGMAQPNVEVANKCIMVENCYRRTWQMNERWMSRIRSMRNFRVSIVNPANGKLANAAVFSDFCLVPSERGLMLMYPGDDNSQQPEKRPTSAQYMYNNILGYSDTEPSPALMTILDADQGIILVEFKTDPMGLNQCIIPGLVDHNPNLDIRDEQNHTADSRLKGNQSAIDATLSSSYRMKVIFTAVPAAPNNDQKLYSVVITPSQVEEKLGYKLGECVGPDMEIFVDPRNATAKIGWNDSRINDIEKVFGVGGNGQPNLQGLILNDTGQSNPETGADLNNVAMAVAMQTYSALVDRAEGGQAGYLNPNIQLEGWTSTVTHSLSPGGEIRTGIMFPPNIPRMNLSDFLDSGTRKAYYHLVQPQGVT